MVYTTPQNKHPSGRYLPFVFIYCPKQTRLLLMTNVPRYFSLISLDEVMFHRLSIRTSARVSRGKHFRSAPLFSHVTVTRRDITEYYSKRR